MGIRVETRGVEDEFDRYRRDQVPRVRREELAAGLSDVIDDIADDTPVRTGRARRGWLATQGRSTPQAGGDGTSRIEDSATVTQANVTNEVPYVRFLEYGTRRMRGQRIVARVLARHVASMLSRLKRALRPEG